MRSSAHGVKFCFLGEIDQFRRSLYSSNYHSRSTVTLNRGNRKKEVIMDLLDYLSEEEWQAVEAGNLDGFDEYRIVHRRSEGGGKYKYSAVHNKDEIPVELYISGASETRDPLKEIQLINLRVDEQKFITGIDDNGDCVIRK